MTEDRMKVLVIGGTRFIGRGTVERLLERGHDVTIFNRGTKRCLWPGRIREVYGDRTDPSSLLQLRDLAFDGVFDFCAYSGGDTSALLDVVGSIRRFVQMSSGTVYRMHPVLPWREDVPYGPAPLWGAYARGKIECEQVLRSRRSPTVATTAIRAPWVLGPRSYAEREKFVFNRVLDRAEVLIPGDGKALQQFVSSDSLAHSLVAVLETFDSGGWRAFNIASPGYTSNEGFVRICASVVGIEPMLRYVDHPRDIQDVAFNMRDAIFPFPNENYLLDVSVSEQAGIAPPVESLEDTVTRTLEDMRTNPENREWKRTEAELSVLNGKRCEPT